MVILDVETTGFYADTNAIIELGALDFSNPENQFYEKCRIWEGAEVDPDSLRFNGNSEADINDPDRMSTEELLKKFIDWLSKIEDRTIAGQNVDFDLDFLNASKRRCGIKWDFGRRKVDHHSITYAHLLKRGQKVPLKNGCSALSGDTIMEYVGVPKEPMPHIGINGAKYQAEAFSRLLYGKILFPEFEQYLVPNYLL